MTARRKLASPVADAVLAYVASRPGATVRDVAGALFASHANGGIPAAQNCLTWLLIRARLTRETFGPNDGARYTARTARSVCAEINRNGVSLPRAPWEITT